MITPGELLNTAQRLLSDTPDFTLFVDDKNITTDVKDRLISLTLTDNRGLEADQLNIELNDADGKLALPRRGAGIRLALGWAGQKLADKGTFTVDEIEHSGTPDVLTITARSADFRSSLNIKRSAGYHQTTLGSIIKTLAERNSLATGIAPSMAAIHIDHIDQTNESDANFLTRLAKMEGAIATIKGGKLLFIVPGQALSASGKPLGAIIITRQDGDNHQFSIADRNAYTGVQAHWLDTLQGRPKKVIVLRKRRRSKKNTEPPDQNGAPHKPEGDYLAGSEGNILVLRHTYAYEANARRAARAEWQRIQRGAASLTITLAKARPDVFPELPVSVQGFKRQIDNAQWLIKTVTHQIADGGYTQDIEMEVRAEDVEMD
ncbi:phage late control D family protein [Serratia marcescens]|uniref:Phage late control D family protein n=1 Tax=Serratia marcescens TaxID=615 RepID=A0A5C7CDZ4_SERMA|nr:phage late control D family protein [Serratia marcescens]TXE33262.1 phage late control D family protein [Serratia marcescens]TXE65214.1 phage late control D family protein [Serratia marcescens]